MKPIKQWEAERGLIMPSISEDDAKTSVDEVTFDQLLIQREHVGVMHEDRIKFLTAHGYEVTRSSMVDGNLSAKS
jgi:hypothetical protein